MTAIDAAPPGRWAFLYPWCRVLRHKLNLEGQTAENSARWEYHSVEVRLPHAPDKADVHALRRIREALDLLARVALVDNAAWRVLLQQQCRVARDEDDQPLDSEFRPRFRFVFNEKFLEPGALSPAAVCKEFFLTTHTQRASDDYMEARRALTEVEASLGRDVDVETPVPFELQFELMTLPDDTLETHLRDLNAVLGVLQAQQRREIGAGGLLPLELESIRLDIGGVTMSWSLTQRLTSLLTSGLPFSLFAFSLKKPTEENYEGMREYVGRFLRTVCGQAPRDGHFVDAKQGGVKMLSVGCHDCDEWQFAALCSAIGSASVTKRLALYGVYSRSDTAEVRRWKWQWLAYALFRTSTDSSVQRALITAHHLTHEVTLAIAVAIHSNSPPATVSAEIVRDESLLNLDAWRHDTSGYFVKDTELKLLDPTQGGNGGSASILLEEDSWLHIVNDDDDDNFNVVVPGFGIARVDKFCATQVERRQHQTTDTASCGLKALNLGLGYHSGDDGGEVFADFLQLIGRRLQSLGLYAMGSYPISMASIGQACPQLTDLVIQDMELSNPSAFCLDVERSHCKLKCLRLVNAFSSNDQITRFAQTIATSSSHMAQHLTELGISGSEASCRLDETNVQTFLSMLQTNHKLTYVSLGMNVELQTLHDENFRRHHGEPLPIVKDKLPTVNKLAFLSAVRGRQQATTELDDGVLTHILGFAANCATRAVRIHYDD
ncbi:hypothetical protein PF005_g6290 [Phytophthora fragariae]|uniref:Uncharacterized protein n=2 Tax=Phytophthora fragariae TaxID=53985 RepID=A0A6A3ZVS0_9STRA|nr:hypothetical protein PF003_g2475 [Phytophthora fragariae]KAE8943802.1 hypothetical protein PF009_g6485 [Phytophthora fragariae]KAE9016890.1 hypothetical protein PF011_g6940 [Phytophthora fragariae]KAE9125221.1 hypothetical protein PF007_g6432 [Phytophthora fragariae]KAE9150336.1 hypothetical protein PF006_g5281 [Phytophthora fragariae]